MTVRRLLVAITLALGLLAAAWGALLVLDLLSRTEERSVRTLPDAPQVRLETGSGDIEVVASAGPPRVELRTTSGLWGAPRVKFTYSPGGLVSIELDCPGLSSSCSAEARLLVPAGKAVAARTGSGTVAVRGIRGGVDVSTGSGDVELTDVGGARVLADTGSGSIDATGVRTAALRADTGSGDVDASFATPPSDVLADTGSGGVELRLPDVGYAIETDTGSGEERIDVRRDDGSGRRIRIDTGSGDVRVLPAR